MAQADAVGNPHPPFERYGISLQPLQASHLEMVRQWRNDPKISAMMLDQRLITPQMQADWFASISASSRHFCFVAYFRHAPIGFASLTRLADQPEVAEPGLYIYDDRYRGNLVPFCVVFALLDYAFEQLALQRLVARVFDYNQPALRFNAACGYKPVLPLHEGLNAYELSPSDYIQARTKLSRFIRY